jgi:hypothetical protein
MEQFKIVDKNGLTHLVFIGWNRLLSNDQSGIFVHCPSKKLPKNEFHKLGAFSKALTDLFGNDRLVKV